MNEQVTLKDHFPAKRSYLRCTINVDIKTLLKFFLLPQKKNTLSSYFSTQNNQFMTEQLKHICQGISIIYYFGKNGTARPYLSGASCDTESTGCEAWI